MNIVFIKPSPPYLVGNIAHFPDAKAAEYIRSGKAIEYKPAPVLPADRTPTKSKMIKK